MPVRTEARRLQVPVADLVGNIRNGSNYLLPLSPSAPHDVGQVLALAETGRVGQNDSAGVISARMSCATPAGRIDEWTSTWLMSVKRS